jgi:hypothetical protein
VEESNNNVTANKLAYDLAQVKLEELNEKQDFNEQVEWLSNQIISDVFTNVSKVWQDYATNEQEY